MSRRATVAVLLVLASVGGLACGDATDTATEVPGVGQDAAARREALAEARQERVAAQRQARREARRAGAEARRTRIRAERRAALAARVRAERRAARAAAEEVARAEAAAEASSCDPNYSGACLDPDAYDYDCEGGSGDGPEYTGAVQVVGSDPHGLDSDGDGYACE